MQLKPHGAVYGMTARDMALARAAVGVAKLFGVPFMGLAGTCHQTAAKELEVPFIAGMSHFLSPPVAASRRARVAYVYSTLGMQNGLPTWTIAPRGSC